jgi:hypothetical protein
MAERVVEQLRQQALGRGPRRGAGERAERGALAARDDVARQRKREELRLEQGATTSSSATPAVAPMSA